MGRGEKDRLQVLESRFDLNDRRVWFGRAKLLPDRVLLRGLGYERRILLDEIVEVRWAADELVLVLSDGEEVDMTIRSAALWKYELQARCGLKDASHGNALPGGASETRRIAPTQTNLADGPPGADRIVVNVPVGDGQSIPEPEVGGTVDATQDEASVKQTDMFMERDSAYRIRSPFADDRPGRDPRATE